MNPYALATVLLAIGAAGARGQWEKQTINTDADFRGLCAVS